MMQGNDTELIWEAYLTEGDIPDAEVRNRDMGEIYRRIQKIQKAVEGIDDIKSLEAVEEIIQMIQSGEDEGLYDLNTDPDAEAREKVMSARRDRIRQAAQRGEAAQKRRPTSHPSFDEPSFGTDFD
jgi:hypothetical protein